MTGLVGYESFPLTFQDIETSKEENDLVLCPVSSACKEGLLLLLVWVDDANSLVVLSKEKSSRNSLRDIPSFAFIHQERTSFEREATSVCSCNTYRRRKKSSKESVGHKKNPCLVTRKEECFFSSLMREELSGSTRSNKSVKKMPRKERKIQDTGDLYEVTQKDEEIQNRRVCLLITSISLEILSRSEVTVILCYSSLKIYSVCISGTTHYFAHLFCSHKYSCLLSVFASLLTFFPWFLIFHPSNLFDDGLSSM